MKNLKRIVEQHDTMRGRIFDLAMQFFIVLALVTFSMETLPGLADSTRLWLDVIEIVTIAVFTVEYMLRILVADRKVRFLCSFFGIIDLLAILPFYLGLGVDLRSLRSLRLLRLFRTFKVVRYNKAFQRFHRALLIAREELVIFMIVMLLLLYFSAVGIYYFEHDAQPETFASVFHSLWWAVVTLTTVGYGDVLPITTGGRIFTGFVLLLGLGFISVPAGLMASAFSKARELED